MRQVISIHDRFWSKVDKSEDCWLWTAATDPNGYGRVRYNRENNKAHRVAWILTNGKIPIGLCVLHDCDNPPCVNPDHLYVGTMADNCRDRDEKGRGVAPPVHSGETHHFAKLTNEQIAEIRELHVTGEYTFTVLGQMYGVSLQSISNYINGRARWVK